MIVNSNPEFGENKNNNIGVTFPDVDSSGRIAIINEYESIPDASSSASTSSSKTSSEIEINSHESCNEESLKKSTLKEEAQSTSFVKQLFQIFTAKKANSLITSLNGINTELFILCIFELK